MPDFSGLIALGEKVLNIISQRNFWIRGAVISGSVILGFIGVFILIRKPIAEAGAEVAKVL